MNEEGVTLKISLSPRDHQFFKYLLPHQLNVWHKQVNEILIVFDLDGYNTSPYQSIISDIKLFVDTLKQDYPAVNLIIVNYANKVRKEVSKLYFGGKKVPLKTHRYGPYYSYFYGIFKAKYNYVLNIDSDIFFGGYNPQWINQAIALLRANENILTCSPLPGPPRLDGKLMDQAGTIDKSALHKVIFSSFSTRIFFIDKRSFIKYLCPLPIRVARLPTMLKALIRLHPVFMLPEDVITDIMIQKDYKRIDFSGSDDGLWSLHPPFRNADFFEKLPQLVKDIERNEIPEAQRGYYDINDSMVNWEDARLQIKNASIKGKILKFLRLKS